MTPQHPAAPEGELTAADVDPTFARELSNALVEAMCKSDVAWDESRAREVRSHMRTALAAVGVAGAPAAPEGEHATGAIVPERQRCICGGICLEHCRACNYSGRDLEEPCIADPDWEADDDDLARREQNLPAAPEGETDASGLREALAAGFAAGWASALDADDAEFVQTDPEAMETAYYYADLIAPTVERIVAERLRVVEGERDAEAERARYLETELDADAKHAALKPGETCDVCTHLESEQMQAWMNADLDWQDRAESAEAAHAALVAGVERLADAAEWRAETSLSRTFTGETFGAWVPASDLRALLAGGGA